MSLTRVALIVVALVAAVAGAYALFRAWDDRSAPLIVIEDAAAILPVVVDVRGAVRQPGVFELAPGARVQDAIDAAGGLASDADLSDINLARRLGDGEVVVIPTHRTPGASPAAPGEFAGGELTGDAAMPRINLNTASATQLEELPGVGKITADRIVAYREENGPFRSVDDLFAVDGISPKMIDEFRDLVTTGP